MIKPLYKSILTKVTVSRTCRYLHLQFNQSDLDELGKRVRAAFLKEHCKPLRTYQSENEKKVCVNRYPMSFLPEMIWIIDKYFNSKNNTSIKPYPTEDEQSKPSIVNEPKRAKRPRIKRPV